MQLIYVPSSTTLRFHWICENRLRPSKLASGAKLLPYPGNIEPDIPVERKVEDFVHGVDGALEAIFDYVAGQNK